MLETESLPKIARASSHKDVFAGLWGRDKDNMHKLTRNKSMIYGRLELESMANKASKSDALLRKKRSNEFQEYSLANTVLVVVDDASRNAQSKDINRDIDYIMAAAWSNTESEANATSLIAGNPDDCDAIFENAGTPSESLEEKSPLMFACDGADVRRIDSIPSEQLSYAEDTIENIMHHALSPAHAKPRDYLSDHKHSSEPILWSTTTESTVTPLARSASHAVDHRDWLMEEKHKAIQRLQSMGYDPYKGVYVAHRGRLMEEKTKAVNRMQSLGFDPYKGVYCAHRGELMKEKEKVLTRLTSLGFDARGTRKH